MKTSRTSSAKSRGTAARKPAASGRKTTATSKTSTTARNSGPRRSASSVGSTLSDNLNKIMRDNLKDIYWAEKHLVRGLTKMVKAADSGELKQGFDKHREETLQQIEQLETAFEILGMKAQGKKCAAMEGLLKEGEEQIEQYEQGPARDAALIVSAQKIEHYEIAAYGSLRTFAATLGHNKCEMIFQGILDQESATDTTLSDLAMTINRQAMKAHSTVRMEEEMEE